MLHNSISSRLENVTVVGDNWTIGNCLELEFIFVVGTEVIVLGRFCKALWTTRIDNGNEGRPNVYLSNLK